MFTYLTRRAMLKLSATTLAGSVLASCAPKPAAQPTAAPTSAPAQATAVPPTAEPTVPPATAVPATPALVTIMYARLELSEEQQAQFEKDNPDVKIELVENDPVRFMAMVAAGTPPDLCRTGAANVPNLLARRLIRDLTPYFEVSAVLKPDDLAPVNNYYRANGPTETGQGPIYGMVKDWSPDFTVWCNYWVTEQAGLTKPDDTKPLSFAEVRAIAEKCMKKEGDRTVTWGYGWEHAWTDRMWMVGLLETGDGIYTDGFSKMDITENEAAKEIVKFYFDLMKDDLVSNPINPTSSWFIYDVMNSLSPLGQYGYWFGAMAADFEEDAKKRVILLPAPRWNPQQGKRISPCGVAVGTVMISSTQVPDAAWKVYEWYNGKEPALERAKSGWGLPALKSMLDLLPEETDFQKQSRKVALGEVEHSGETMKFNPFLAEGAANEIYWKHLEPALRGQITFDELLTNVETEVNAAIREGIDRLT